MASSSHLLFRPTPPPPTFFCPFSLFPLLLKPLSSAAVTHAANSDVASSSAVVHSLHLPRTHVFLSRSIASTYSIPTSSLTLSFRHRYGAISHASARAVVQELDSVGEVNDDDGSGGEIRGEEDVLLGAKQPGNSRAEEEKFSILAATLDGRKAPELTLKEKKELASYARSLGDKLKCQQVGKSGVAENVFMALNETLEANELLKLKIHSTCPGELEDVVEQLERGTASVAVGQIGRTVIFYRPSLSKLKSGVKKRQAQVSFQRETRSKAMPQRRVQLGRRKSKFSTSSRSKQ